MVGPETNSRDRGQVILIGAITLAFIVLGIVVVFNGILYTEGLSSGTSSQAATDAEIKQGVGCLLVETNGRSAWEDETDPSKADVRSEIEGNINEFSESYRGVKSQSSPSIIIIKYNDATVAGETGDYELESTTVTVSYDSHDLSYETKLDIEPSDCPGNGS